MKVTKTEIRFKTGFQQPKTGLPKKTGINIPTFLTRKTPFFLCSYFHAYSTTLLLKIFGGTNACRPPTSNFWGTVPPYPLGLRPCACVGYLKLHFCFSRCAACSPIEIIDTASSCIITSIAAHERLLEARLDLASVCTNDSLDRSIGAYDNQVSRAAAAAAAAILCLAMYKD